MPGCLLSRYSPLPGRSVPLSWVTRYCSGVSWAMAAGSLRYWFMQLSCGTTRGLVGGPLDGGGQQGFQPRGADSALAGTREKFPVDPATATGRGERCASMLGSAFDSRTGGSDEQGA